MNSFKRENTLARNSAGFPRFFKSGVTRILQNLLTTTVIQNGPNFWNSSLFFEIIFNRFSNIFFASFGLRAYGPEEPLSVYMNYLKNSFGFWF